MRAARDPLASRLRWVMLGAMAFSAALTIAGQPREFWANPEAAMRGDGLGLHHPTNHAFEFFLGSGAGPYAAACAAYFALAFAAVSVLPRRAASIAALTATLGHFFGGSNWLATRWHLGMEGPVLYSIAMGGVLAAAALPALPNPAGAIRRLRRLMLAPMALDAAVTLIGQPAAYWSNAAAVREGNHLSRYFLLHGWWAYALYQAAYMAGLFRLAGVLPRMSALVLTFACALGGFVGTSCWFFYDWRLGMEAPVALALALSAAIVLFALPEPAEPAPVSPGAAPLATDR